MKSYLIAATEVFISKVMFFRTAQKVIPYLGYFCTQICHRDRKKSARLVTLVGKLNTSQQRDRQFRSSIKWVQFKQYLASFISNLLPQRERERERERNMFLIKLRISWMKNIVKWKIEMLGISLCPLCQVVHGSSVECCLREKDLNLDSQIERKAIMKRHWIM